MTLNSELFIWARYIWQTEGVVHLLHKVIASLIRRAFQYGTFYLYETKMRERTEAAFMPKIHKFALYMVSTNQQVDELVANGFDFCPYSHQIRRNLDTGAIVCCIFIGQELASMGWVALTQKAMDAVEPYPLHVDFSNNEAGLGGSLTIPKYRGRGLQTYIAFKRRQYLREKERIISRSVIGKDNISSQGVINKFDPTLYAKAFYLRILWWKFWRETPLCSVRLQQK